MLKGKVVLVIGVSWGIGWVIVKCLVNDGVLVVVYYGSWKDDVEEIVYEIWLDGG